MKPEEIPQELIDILDRRAGKKHSATGPVVEALAEILTEYEKIRQRTHVHINLDPLPPTIRYVPVFMEPPMRR